MQASWISSVVSMTVFAAWAFVLCVTLRRRYGWLPTVLLYLLGAPFYFALPQYVLPYGTLSRALVGMIAFSMLQLVLFREKWYKTLFVVGVLFGLMMVAELLVVALATPPAVLREGMETQIQPTFSVGTYAMYLAIHAILLWGFTLFLKRYQYRLLPTEWLLYLAFPVSQCLLLLGWMDVSRMDLEASRVFLMLAAMAVCVAADAALFQAVRGMAQRGALRSKNELLEAQIAMQKEHYAAITAQYQAIRRMRHDIASHLYTMELLLQQGKYREAAAYSKEVKAANEGVSCLGLCENPVADAYLTARLGELRGQGVDVSAEVSIPDAAGVSDADLIIALENLLNNAWEAIQESTSPQLRLRVKCREIYLQLETENTVSAASRTKKRRIPELELGIGLYILKDLAEKYQGSFTCRQEGAWFFASLILQRRTEGHAVHCDL